VIDPVRLAFAANLHRARIAAGLTQAELAARSGVTQPHISQLKAAIWEPRLTTIVALADALQLRPADLMEVRDEAT